MHHTDSHIEDLIDFLDNSPVNFLAAAQVAARLDNAGFIRLEPTEEWTVEKGGKYYIVKNSSAVFAFIVGHGHPSAGYHIISAHSDSPCFRIKPNAEILCPGGAVKLNVEVYGGPILYTWFDRPLSVAGRVIVKSASPLHPETRLIHIRRPLLTIPHLAIHFNRQVNDGNPLSRQKDMLPVIALIKDATEKDDLLLNLVAEEAGVDKSDILDFDLSLYDTTPACRLGLNDEFITSGRLDDLSMVHAALSALLSAPAECDATRVMAIFDNEETGSGTKQGAASPVLDHLLRRINACAGGKEEDYFRAIDNSFMISADNAHGVHPNYVEKQDPTNHPALGGGPVIKINANCKYMTDADSAAVFRSLCDAAGVPCQYFVNHSDVAGGSTLGNILTSQIDLRGVDMGAALWAMHSVRETASAADHDMIIRVFGEFYSL
ncbi:MAG: M18 family aminopeptidase [Bacteroides sp.]|nr:M18 family aminopeptidase [Bacteroidales bacterium]MBD5344591.1 M18 family aminopeptidase [Bacteroides sp.]MBD5369045.1 M18 family aminopeptidase [Bacteroides sp.]